MSNLGAPWGSAQAGGGLLLAVAVIVLSVRLVGAVTTGIGQPRIVGELVAGVVLGPGILGQVLPGVTAFLFPADVLGSLRVLAELGLIMFMTLVGMELDLTTVRNRTRTVVAVCHATVLVPMALAAALAQLLYPIFESSVGRPAFTLFFAAAMSVTALPVLARLLRETGLLHTKTGSISLTCAAVNDVVAWLMLGGVVALIGAAGAADALLSVLLVAAYVVVMLTAVRPLLRRLQTLPVWGVIAVAMLSAWAAEHVGIHAVFGGFLAGAVMPRSGRWQRRVDRQLDGIVANLLLPIFFVLVGLSMRVDQLTSAGLWLIALLVFVVATLGKLGGAAVAARLAGESWRDGLTIGTLMNARGVTEIVFLTVGLELGVVSPPLFTIMVLMAVGTTVAAAPVLRLVAARPAAGDVRRPSNARLTEQR